MRLMKPNAKVRVLLVGEDTSGQNVATYSIGTTTFVEADIYDNDDSTTASVNITPLSATVAESAGAMARFNITATVGTN